MAAQGQFQCFCGESFADREMLVQHNVDEHAMGEAESRRRVLEKYPERG